MEGTLEKRGAFNVAWRQRHFVLAADGVLRYFETEAAYRAGAAPKGQVLTPHADAAAAVQGPFRNLSSAFTSRV